MTAETEPEGVRLMTRLLAMCPECRNSVLTRLPGALATGTKHDRQVLKTEIDSVTASSTHEACRNPETGDAERRLRAVAADLDDDGAGDLS